jgi:ABC-type nitrate/sulfonate/bicarbonate transport system substrate-binding protein
MATTTTTASSPAAHEPIRVALDWTPNANHVGLYVAAAKGWASLSFLSPDRDGYKTTPAKAVLAGDADLAVAPTETAIAYACPKEGASSSSSSSSAQQQRPPPALVSVAALLQKDTSALAALEEPKQGVERSGGGGEGTSGKAITRPRDLDGALYASYAARYEGSIVRAVIRADGGKGSVVEVTPPKLDCFQRVLDGDADATWIFLPHEGVQASRAGIRLRTWPVGDFGVPYGYSPVLLAPPSLLASPARSQHLRAALQGIAQGYEFAAAHPAEAAAILRAHSGHATLQDEGFVRASVEAVAPALLGEGGKWGRQEEGVWEAFLRFLEKEGLVEGKEGGGPEAGRLFTNDFLPA